MKVLQEYKRLTKNVRVARQNLRDAKSNVTTMRVTCDWADCSEDARSCINCYSGMVMPLFAKGSFERFEITKYCPRFDCHKPCQNNDCEYQEQNWDAVAAQFAYDDARAARREFISGAVYGSVKNNPVGVAMGELKEKIAYIRFLRQQCDYANKNFRCNKDMVKIDDFGGGAHIVSGRCPEYNAHRVCDKQDCPNHDWNKQYVSLLNRLCNAKQKRNQAILNLFGIKKK